MRVARYFLGFLFLALASLASAGTLTFVTTGSNAYGNVYTYPYYFSVDGSSDPKPMMCLSYDNEIVLGESWAFYLLPVTTQAEKEAAWLLNDAETYPGNDVDDNLAAWSLFAADAPLDSGAEAQLSLAAIGYGKIDASRYVLYVPVPGFNTPGAPQTFIGDSPVPEPFSLLLLGSGALMLAIRVRKQ